MAHKDLLDQNCYQTTYKELKPTLAGFTAIMHICYQTTYKELKLPLLCFAIFYFIGYQTTYKELKPDIVDTECAAANELSDYL